MAEAIFKGATLSEIFEPMAHILKSTFCIMTVELYR